MKIIINNELTNSKVLQLRSQPEDEQQRLRRRATILPSSGVELPCLSHQATKKYN